VANLKDILYGVALTEVVGSTDQEVTGLTIDSRAAESGWLFAAIRGTQVDGHDYIDQAIKQGATAILCEEIPADPGQTTFLKVASTGLELGTLASNFYGNPSERINLIGITGTNGKTTTATLLYRLFTQMGHECGLLSTIVNRIGGEVIDATHTTPDVITINKLMHDMVMADCDYCFMEVSSHAIDQQRIAGLKFKGGVFTNITHDHLDYHKTFKEYIRVKKQFFDGLPEGAFALTNVDDRQGQAMVTNTKAKVHTYGLKTMADFKGKILEDSFTGLILAVDNEELHSQLVGEFNAYNLLVVYGVAAISGFEKIDVLAAISQLQSAEGRFDSIISPQAHIRAIVDYAHTPDALKNVLQTIKKIRTGTEKVITLFGCGGDRDKTKRPVMAEVACEFSDQVIFTADNPRSEDPQTIISEMMDGVPPHHKSKVLAITDRQEAIRTACTMAQAEDIIIIAGKGHEKYQEIAGVKHPFDDMAVLTESFQTLNK
jgi:UDP-N-acetylmuramoyl-L-alanyl-D-glutamate--2,6-diaminopimelate ligase